MCWSNAQLWVPCLNSLNHFPCGFLKARAQLKALWRPLHYDVYLTQPSWSSRYRRCHAQLLKWRLILWSRYTAFRGLTEPHSDWHMAFNYTHKKTDLIFVLHYPMLILCIVINFSFYATKCNLSMDCVRFTLKHSLPYRCNKEWWQHCIRSLSTSIRMTQMHWDVFAKFHTTFQLCQLSRLNSFTRPRCHPGVLLCVWPEYPDLFRKMPSTCWGSTSFRDSGLVLYIERGSVLFSVVRPLNWVHTLLLHRAPRPESLWQNNKDRQYVTVLQRTCTECGSWVIQQQFAMHTLG